MTIIKKKYVIDSSFIQQDILTFTDSTQSNFIYNLSTPIKNVKKISLTDIIIPSNINNFSSKKENNILRIREFIWYSYIHIASILNKKNLL